MNVTTSASAAAAASASALPIQVTPRAVDELRRMLAEAEPDVVGFRIGVKGGGCSGYYYAYDFATKIRPGRDAAFDLDGVTLVVDNRSLELLKGSTLDWERNLMSYGFKWTNPNARGDCGCGESFNVG